MLSSGPCLFMHFQGCTALALVVALSIGCESPLDVQTSEHSNAKAMTPDVLSSAVAGELGLLHGGLPIIGLEPRSQYRGLAERGLGRHGIT